MKPLTHILLALVMAFASCLAIANEGKKSLASLSDEFNATLGKEWRVLNREMLGALEIKNDRLIMTPAESVGTFGWYMDGQGPMIFKSVEGNFVIEISLKVGSLGNHDEAPTNQFNSAGIMVRSPASKAGSQNWIMYNIGFQYASFGREAKTTENSNSTLHLGDSPAKNNSGKLRVCRINNDFYLYHWLSHESAWIGETTVAKFERKDMPAVVDVGLVINAYAAPKQTRAEFDYVRFSAAASRNDCTK